MGAEPVAADAGPRCLRCGSRLERQEVLEHRPCGGIWGRSIFSTERGLHCPDCTRTANAEFDSVGILYTCVDCGERFDKQSLSATPTEEPPRSADHRRASRVRRAHDGESTSAVRKTVSGALALALLVAAIGGAAAVSPYLATTDEPDEWAWVSYESIVVFRNDDIQPYYRTESMKAVNRIFIEEGVPVTQGVIPAVDNDTMIASGNTCSYLRTLERNHPELFEVALHGYTHERLTDFHSGSEFGGLPYREQAERIETGARILADCVDHRTTTFIPPMDTYDNRTVRALAEENFTLVSGGGWFTREYYAEEEVFWDGGLLHVPNSQSFVENWTTNEFHSQSELRRSFDRAYANGSIYVQMLHYPQFTTVEERNTLRGLIQYMKSKGGVKFTTLGDLAEGFRTGSIRQTEDGWQILERISGANGRESPGRDAVSAVIDRVARLVVRITDASDTRASRR